MDVYDLIWQFHQEAIRYELRIQSLNNTVDKLRPPQATFAEPDYSKPGIPFNQIKKYNSKKRHGKRK